MSAEWREQLETAARAAAVATDEAHSFSVEHGMHVCTCGWRGSGIHWQRHYYDRLAAAVIYALGIDQVGWKVADPNTRSLYPMVGRPATCEWSPVFTVGVLSETEGT